MTRRGRVLAFAPVPGAPAASLGVLRRIVGAYAGSLRGRESLHATALSRGGRAVAVLGSSGEGKSTLAASLLLRGLSWRLMTDDILGVRFGRGRAWAATRGACRLKIRGRPAWLEALASRRGASLAYDPNMDKNILRFAGRPAGARLCALVQLRRAGGRARLRVERLAGAQASLVLMGSLYNDLLRPPAVRRRQMEFCAALARRVPVWRLRYPTGPRGLAAAARAVSGLCV